MGKFIERKYIIRFFKEQTSVVQVDTYHDRVLLLERTLEPEHLGMPIIATSQNVYQTVSAFEDQDRLLEPAFHMGKNKSFVSGWIVMSKKDPRIATAQINMHSFDDNPAQVLYDTEGHIKHVYYYKNGISHRSMGPSRIHYTVEGARPTYAYHHDGKDITKHVHMFCTQSQISKQDLQDDEYWNLMLLGV